MMHVLHGLLGILLAQQLLSLQVYVLYSSVVMFVCGVVDDTAAPSEAPADLDTAADQLEVEDPGLNDLARRLAADALQGEAAAPSQSTATGAAAVSATSDIQVQRPGNAAIDGSNTAEWELLKVRTAEMRKLFQVSCVTLYISSCCHSCWTTEQGHMQQSLVVSMLCWWPREDVCKWQCVKSVIAVQQTACCLSQVCDTAIPQACFCMRERLLIEH